MAFTRRYGRKRYGRKKVYKRRPFNRHRGIRTRKNGTKIFYFKRTLVEEFTITNAGFVAGVTYGITNVNTLNMVPNATEFTELFDFYKICGLSKKWVFSKTSAEIGTTAEVPNLLTYNDYNDSTAIVNEDEMLQVPSYKASPLNKPRSRYYKPTPEYTNKVYGLSRGWIATSQPTIAHYGLKWAIDTTDATTGTTYGICRLYTKYYLAFKNPK